MSGEPIRDAAVERLLGGTLARGAAAPDGCLDAETVAAWTDGRLSAASAAAAEEHAAVCARCQALVAAGLRSAPEVPAAQPWWRFARVRWLVPITAATAAVVIWTIVPTDRVGDLKPVAPSERASQGAQPPQSDLPEGARERQKQSAQPAPQRELADRIDARSATPAVPPPAPPDDQKPAERREAAAEAEPLARAEPRQQPAPSAPPTAQESVRLRGNAADTFSAFRDSAAVLEVRSPDPSLRWRAVAPGAVERSTDGGATWERIPIDADRTLTAGASPSAAVCWLVGGAGTVLVTTNGRDWRRASAPVPDDLVSVRASDAQTATVSTAAGRTFRTTDGGRSWQPVVP